MEELLVIDKILDFLVPVKLRGKRMGILMERGVKLLFLCVVILVSAEIILRKTIDAIGDTNQWSYAIGYMVLYSLIAVVIYALVMGGVNMLISSVADMKREQVVKEEAKTPEKSELKHKIFTDKLDADACLKYISENAELFSDGKSMAVLFEVMEGNNYVICTRADFHKLIKMVLPKAVKYKMFTGSCSDLGKYKKENPDDYQEIYNEIYNELRKFVKK